MQIKTTFQPNSFRITKKQLWLTYIFPLLFVSDILYGAMDYYGFHSLISPGMLFRGLAFLLSIIMVLKFHPLLPRNVFWWALATTILTLPGIIVGAVIGGDTFRDIFYMLRILYGPFLILLLIILIRKYSIKAEEILLYIEFVVYVLGISLLLSQYFGIQRATYGDYAYGNTGIFYAQNDLSLTFGLALLAASYRIVVLFSLTRLVLIGLTMIACLQIGTRASIVVILVNALVIVTLAVWGRQADNNKRSYWQFIRLLFSIIVAAGMIALSAYGLNLHSQSSYQKNKIEKIIRGELPRSLLVSAGRSYLEDRASLFTLTGEGMTSYMRGVARYFPASVDEKSVEVDWMDLFGSYGIVFTCLIYIFFFAVLFGSSKYFLSGPKDTIYGVVAAAVGMYIGHSMLAGHAMFSPISTTLIAGYVAVYITLRSIRRERLSDGRA